MGAADDRPRRISRAIYVTAQGRRVVVLRFAKATGHRLKISFQPLKGKG